MDQEENFNLKNFYESMVIKEKKSRRRLILLAVIPVLIGITWYSWSAVQVQEFAMEKNRQARDAETYKRIADENRMLAMAYKDQFDSMKAQVESDNRARSAQPQTVSPEVQQNAFRQFLRGVATPRYNDVRENMRTEPIRIMFNMRARNVRYRSGGRTISEGFDSYTLVNYVLHHSDRGRFPERLTSAELKSRLTPVQGHYRNGDILFYADGSVMIYTHAYPRAFCIGMTKYGVMTMDPGFDRVVAAYRVLPIIE